MAKSKFSKAKKNGKAALAEKREVQTLDRRDVTLPRNLVGRVQDHGDEPVSALDLRVSFAISDEEACALAKEKYFTRGLFISGGRGKPDRPLIPKLAIRLETIESARVSLFLGANAGGEFKLGVCKLKSPELLFKLGRQITVTTLVQSTPSSGARVGEVWSRMDTGAQIRIEYEHNAEQLEADVTADQPAKRDAEAEGFEADAKAQVEAWNRGSDAGAESPAEAH